jgi:two-component system response regulator DesR
MTPDKKLTEPVRVVVAEDNDDLRTLMTLLLNEESDIDCVAATAFIDEVGPVVAQHRAQVVILDVQLRGGSALKRLPELSCGFPDTKFIMHSGHSNPDLIRGAYAAGAAAYVLKSGDIDELLAAIRKVASN